MPHLPRCTTGLRRLDKAMVAIPFLALARDALIARRQPPDNIVEQDELLTQRRSRARSGPPSRCLALSRVRLTRLGDGASPAYIGAGGRRGRRTWKKKGCQMWRFMRDKLVVPQREDCLPGRAAPIKTAERH